MAALDDRNGNFRVLFRYGGKQFNYSLGRPSPADAEAAKARVEYLLRLLDQRVLTLPAGTSVIDFLRHDGRPPSAPTPEAKDPTLAEIRDAYLVAMGGGALEASTLSTARVHFRHLAATLGDRFRLAGLTLADVQRHVGRRQAAGVTIKKEVDTLRAVWAWAAGMGRLDRPFPPGKPVYPKADERPPFMTWAEVARRVRGGANPAPLWGCLYLTAPEVDELLAFMGTARGPGWLYPMVCVAAHTGMRRSELIRAHAADIDLAAGVVTVREKKRAKGSRTTRRVPLTGFLQKLLGEWTASRPGAVYLLGRGERALSPQAAQELLRAALAGSKWEVLGGFHTLRHSFVSACASKGVDQRLVQEWCGHVDEKTSRRYRHLYPDAQREAIRGVFGGAEGPPAGSGPAPGG